MKQILFSVACSVFIFTAACVDPDEERAAKEYCMKALKASKCKDSFGDRCKWDEDFGDRGACVPK